MLSKNKNYLTKYFVTITIFSCWNIFIIEEIEYCLSSNSICNSQSWDYNISNSEKKVIHYHVSRNLKSKILRKYLELYKSYIFHARSHDNNQLLIRYFFFINYAWNLFAPKVKSYTVWPSCGFKIWWRIWIHILELLCFFKIFVKEIKLMNAW